MRQTPCSRCRCDRCDHVQKGKKGEGTVAKEGRRQNSGRATGQLHTIYEVVEKRRFLQATWVFAELASPHVKRLVRHPTVEIRDLRESRAAVRFGG